MFMGGGAVPQAVPAVAETLAEPVCDTDEVPESWIMPQATVNLKTSPVYFGSHQESCAFTLNPQPVYVSGHWVCHSAKMYKVAETNCRHVVERSLLTSHSLNGGGNFPLARVHDSERCSQCHQLCHRCVDEVSGNVVFFWGGTALNKE